MIWKLIATQIKGFLAKDEKYLSLKREERKGQPGTVFDESLLGKEKMRLAKGLTFPMLKQVLVAALTRGDESSK